MADNVDPGVPSAEPEPPAPAQPAPPSASDDLPPEDVIEATKKRFLDSLLSSAVEELASQQNYSRACRVFARDCGSYNACFFVEFDDGRRWVVRVPIAPLIQQPWEKLQSEVSTIIYLQRTTTIPVPNICAFGRGVALTADKTQTQEYLITEYIDARPLNAAAVIQADPVARAQLFHQLFAVHAQLRRQRFSAIGSLTSNQYGDCHVGPCLSFAANEARGVRLPAFASAREYLRTSLDVVRRNLEQRPVLRPRASTAAAAAADLTDTTDLAAAAVAAVDSLAADPSQQRPTPYERFALHNLRRVCAQLVPAALDRGPFVLHHHDLRLGNILVDGALRVRAILDWEFAHVVPIALAAPPPWTDRFREPGEATLAALFHAQLLAVARHSEEHWKMLNDWYGPCQDARLVARVLRFPSQLAAVFREALARKMFGSRAGEAERMFLEQEAAEAARRNSME